MSFQKPFSCELEYGKRVFPFQKCHLCMRNTCFQYSNSQVKGVWKDIEFRLKLGFLRTSNSSFSHRIYSLRFLSYLKHYFFVLILDSVRKSIQKFCFPLSIVFLKSSLIKLILLFTYWRVLGKFQGLQSCINLIFIHFHRKVI